MVPSKLKTSNEVTTTEIHYGLRKYRIHSQSESHSYLTKLDFGYSDFSFPIY